MCSLHLLVNNYNITVAISRVCSSLITFPKSKLLIARLTLIKQVCYVHIMQNSCSHVRKSILNFLSFYFNSLLLLLCLTRSQSGVLYHVPFPLPSNSTMYCNIVEMVPLCFGSSGLSNVQVEARVRVTSPLLTSSWGESRREKEGARKGDLYLFNSL